MSLDFTQISQLLLAVCLCLKSSMGAERFTFADALTHLPNQQSSTSHNSKSRSLASQSSPSSITDNHIISISDKPKLFISSESPFITTERTAVSASSKRFSNYANYIPLSSRTSETLKNELVDHMSYKSFSESNDVYFDPPEFEKGEIPDATHLIESLINSYLENTTLDSSARITTTKAPALEFLSYSFEEELPQEEDYHHDEYDNSELIRSKVKRADALASEEEDSRGHENLNLSKVTNTNSSESIEGRSNPQKFYANPFHVKKSPASIQVHHHGNPGSQFGDRAGLSFSKPPPGIGSFGPDSFKFSSLIRKHKSSSKNAKSKPVAPPFYGGQLTPTTTTERYRYSPKAPRSSLKPKPPTTKRSYGATGKDPIHSFSSPGKEESSNSYGRDHGGFSGHSGSGGFGHSGGGSGHSGGGSGHSGGGGYDHSGSGHSGGGGFGHSGSGHSGGGGGHSGGGGYGHSASGSDHSGGGGYGHSGSGHSGGGGGHSGGGGGGYGHSGGGDHGKCYDCDHHGGHDSGYKPSRKPGPYGYPSPNFKCEYEKETLYVTKTEYKFKKKCFTVFSTSCKKEHATGKGIGFQKDCNEFSVTRCRTVYDTTFEKKCKTIYKKVCEQIYVTKIDWDYEEKCETVYEEKCSGYGYDKHCEPVPKQNCHQVPVKIEKQVPKTKCKKVPDKKCSDVPKFIPRKECKDFPKKVCTKDPVQVPRNIQIKVCSAHPKEVCIKIPKEVLIQVPKQVTKKVCKSTKGGGGYHDVGHSGGGGHGHSGGGGHGHSGYGREAEEDESSIETYDFDGVADVEFSELHKYDAEAKETEETLDDILTPEWFADNNDWKKRLAEQEERDGRSAEEPWVIDAFLEANRNNSSENTTDFMSAVIQDVTSDEKLGVTDLIDSVKNRNSNETESSNEARKPTRSSQSYSRFHLHNRDNSRSQENENEERSSAQDDKDESDKKDEKISFGFPSFGGFGFGKENPFPSWK